MTKSLYFGHGWPGAYGKIVVPNTSFQRTQTARLFGPLNSDR